MGGRGSLGLSFLKKQVGVGKVFLSMQVAALFII